ncbi:ADP-ribosylation factor-binding protein GGA3 isoform X2 [Nasonia vitripennis]|uniref:ADP-ribosylation factor-binding protein GGA1 n=1 Tax=Nasonia vitripennis TaxID=7425 RepID=A0A7M7Q3T5_NASVI|nr:ADP-ribosylation factor-binding protein GGA3 isoform X2 [Nasonia vitripennis]
MVKTGARKRVINVQNQEIDTAAVDAFCAIITKEVDSIPLATKLLAFWIQSIIERQALQALTLLDTCMQRCGPLFVSEVGKFRFLNEMIKLVSPKYLGTKTPISVREKVFCLLQQWIISFPRETKIKEAYDMLKKQGVIKDDHYNFINYSGILNQSNKIKNPIFDDEEKAKLLQNLLKSKNPSDLHAANRLIKTMVREDEKRTQQELRRVMDLECIHNNVKLLSDMLESYIPTQCKKDDIELMKELYEACEHLRPTLERLAEETQNDEVMLLDIVSASEDLEKVCNKYVLKLLPDQASHLLDSTTETQDTLLDLSSPETVRCSNTDNINSSKEYDDSINCQSDIDLLKDIFECPKSQEVSFQSLDAQLMLSNAPIMQPINIRDTTSKDILDETMTQLHKFEENVLKKSSDIKIHNPSISGCDKISIASIDTLLNKSDIQSFTGVNFMTCKEDNESAEELESAFGNAKCKNRKKTNRLAVKTLGKEFEIESLAHININLETITPGNIPPVTVIDKRNGITVLLHFAKDSPRFDVSVIVVTTMSTSSKPLNDYLFQAVVPEKCKCRLQLPSTTKLPAHNPFLPPLAISQIMLIANPYKEKLSLKFMLSYSMDGETITEMGEVEQLPQM